MIEKSATKESRIKTTMFQMTEGLNAVQTWLVDGINPQPLG